MGTHPEPTIRTTAELQAVLERIQFRNSVMNFDWRFEFQPVSVRYEGSATFFDAAINQTVTSENPVRRGWLLWASFARPDVNSGELGRGRGRDEIIWEGWTESAVVKTAWVIVDLLVKHELMEGYFYRGARIFNPHSTVARLARLQEPETE